MTKVKANDALKAKALPHLGQRKGPPIKASKLVQERYTKAKGDLEKAIAKREAIFEQLMRQHSRIWKIARQVQRYEKLT